MDNRQGKMLKVIKFLGQNKTHRHFVQRSRGILALFSYISLLFPQKRCRSIDRF